MKCKYADSMSQNGFADVVIPLDESVAQVAIDRFHQFLLLPDDVKRQTFSLSDPARQYRLGYYRENKEDQYQGNKEFFHYNDLSAHIHVPDVPEYSALQSVLGAIFSILKGVAFEVVNDLDLLYPGIRSAFFPGDAVHPEIFTLRLVRYIKDDEGACLIKPHYDRGTLTVIVFEDLPGLRFYRNMGDAEHIEERTVNPSRAIVMPGINLKTATHGAIRPLWHDVVQRVDPATGTTRSRTSLLFFIDVVDLKMYSYEERYDKALWSQ